MISWILCQGLRTWLIQIRCWLIVVSSTKSKNIELEKNKIWERYFWMWIILIWMKNSQLNSNILIKSIKLLKKADRMANWRLKRPEKICKTREMLKWINLFKKWNKNRTTNENNYKKLIQQNSLLKNKKLLNLMI